MTQRGEARRRAHLSFDRLWRSGRMTRAGAYRWLARRLGVPEPQAHMGQMEDVETLERVVRLCDEEYGSTVAQDDFEEVR